MILLGIDDPPTLVQARRVNKMLKETYDRNLELPYLQQKLWFKREQKISSVRAKGLDSDCGTSVEGAELEEDDTLLGPRDIEFNPWLARGYIPKLSLQYMDDSLIHDTCTLRDTPVMVMKVEADFAKSWNADDRWHKMELFRAKKKARRGQTLAYITDFRSYPRIVSDLELWWVQDRNLEELVHEAFQGQVIGKHPIWEW